MSEARVTMEERLRHNVRTLIDAYREFFAIPETSVARLLFGESTYFFGVFQQRKAGTSFRVRTYDIIVARFSERWPAALDWPAGIDRIEPSDVTDMPAPPRQGGAGSDGDNEQPEHAAA